MNREMIVSGVVLGLVVFALVYLWDRFIAASGG